MIYVYEYEARNRFSADWICLQGIDCGLGSIGMGGDISWRFPGFGSKDQTIFASSPGGIRFEKEILSKEVHGTV